MAKVYVSRQVTDEDNNLSWKIIEIDESDLHEGESPIPAFLVPKS